YAEALGLPTPQLSLLPRYVGLGTFGVILVLTLASAFPLAGILRLSPQEAVRGERRATDGRVGRFGTWLTSRFSNPTASRYALRNLARARGTTLLTVFAV